MDIPGHSWIQCSSSEPPSTYASPVADIRLRLVAYGAQDGGDGGPVDLEACAETLLS